MKNPTRNLHPLVALAIVALVAAAPAAANAQEEASYGYFRTIEGQVNLTTLDQGDPIEAEINYPVLTGDRIWVTPGSRVEVQLPDRSIVRAAGGTDLFFEELALSASADEDTSTVLRLLTGEIQFVYSDYATYLEPPRIDTGTTTIYLQAPGNYRLLADEERWTEVLVRTGFAEVTTDRGSTVLRGGEEVLVEYGRLPDAVRAANSLDSLEEWGAELEGYLVADASTEYVDESLHYAARPLRGNGSWVNAGGSYGWRPHVYDGWRPYTSGRWIYTPSGLTWVSFEPWGWLTSHYGTWDYAPHHGWLWYPGVQYSPAWVYWYWGPTHVAWAPAGYYSRFYGPRWSSWGFGFNFGVYGWAGGSWNHWNNWTFCPTRYFGRRNYRAYWRSGQQLERHGTLRAVPRGLVTNDTRELHPGRWGKPAESLDALKEDMLRRRGRAAGSRDLPDVTNFIARKENLSDSTRNAVTRRRSEMERSVVDRGKAVGGGRGDLSGRSGGASVGRSAKGEAAPWRVERPDNGRETSRGRTLSAYRSDADRTKTPTSTTSRGSVGSTSRDGRDTPAAADPRSRVVVRDGGKTIVSEPRSGGSSDRVRVPPAAPRSRVEVDRGKAPVERRTVPTPGYRIEERGGAARTPVKKAPPRRALPPSARSESFSGGSRSAAPRAPATGSTPPVRRVLDGIRSYGSKPMPSTPTTSRPSPTDVRRSTPKPSTPQARPPERSTVSKPSPPPRSSSGSRSSTRSPSSSRKPPPSTRSAPSRSSGSKGTSSRGSSRSSRKPKPKPKP